MYKCLPEYKCVCVCVCSQCMLGVWEDKDMEFPGNGVTVWILKTELKSSVGVSSYLTCQVISLVLWMVLKRIPSENINSHILLFFHGSPFDFLKEKDRDKPNTVYTEWMAAYMWNWIILFWSHCSCFIVKHYEPKLCIQTFFLLLFTFYS